MLEELHVYHENYVSVLRCLHVFTSSLPKYPLGKQVMYRYSIWVKEKGFFVSKYDTWISIYSFIFFTILLLCLLFLKMETDAFLLWAEGSGVWFLYRHAWYLVSQQEGVARRRQMHRSAKEPTHWLSCISDYLCALQTMYTLFTTY